MTLRHLLRRAFVLGSSAVALTLFPSGCGSDSSTVGSGITVTGILDGARERAPLAGYTFKCVTLTNPGASNTATADSAGAFSLNFTGGGVPFGCFVLDPSGDQVASVFFTGRGGRASGETITISGNTDFGTITVDTSRGTAVAAATGATVSDDTSGLECPLGVWTGTVGVNSECGGDTVVATLWLGKDGSGNYVLSQALTPLKVGGTCGATAFAPMGAVTYSSYTLGYAFDMGHATTAEAEVSTDCSQISVIFTQTGCGTCGFSANLATYCQGAGTDTCSTNTFALVKQ